MQNNLEKLNFFLNFQYPNVVASKKPEQIIQFNLIVFYHGQQRF